MILIVAAIAINAGVAINAGIAAYLTWRLLRAERMLQQITLLMAVYDREARQKVLGVLQP